MTRHHKTSPSLIGYFAKAYPGRSTLMVVLLALSGLIEGVGVVSLLPLLEIAASGPGGEVQSPVDAWVRGVLTGVGLEPSVGLILVMVVVAITLKSVFLWLAMRQVGFTVAQVTRDLQLELVQALLRARWSYFGRTSIGHLANSITTEANRTASAYRDACIMLGSALQILVYLGVATVTSWRATALALSLGVAVAYGLNRFVRMNRAAGADMTRLMKGLSTRLIDSLKGIKPIKAMAKEGLLFPRFESDLESLLGARRRHVIAAETLGMLFEPLVTVILAVGLYATLTFADLPVSAVIVLAFVFYRIFRHIHTFQSRYLLVVGGESALWSLRDTCDRAAAEVEAIPGTRPLNELRRSIRFDAVSFRYQDHEVVRDTSFEIEAGTFVTFVGASGAGKTTLVDLITGLHLPTEGTIFVDDVPIAELDLVMWRHAIGYVPQETLLFNDTILENVTLGDEALSRDDAEQALKDAGAWDFVRGRPEGLDTVVGESGALLSGGQRQRIAIARALVGSPTLLILDEVTAALDPATEAGICETLVALRGSVTVIAVSHQDALRQAADKVYFVEGGEVWPSDEAGSGEPQSRRRASRQ